LAFAAQACVSREAATNPQLTLELTEETLSADRELSREPQSEVPHGRAFNRGGENLAVEEADAATPAFADPE